MRSREGEDPSGLPWRFPRSGLRAGDDLGLIEMLLAKKMSKTKENLPDFVELANAAGLLLRTISGGTNRVLRSRRPRPGGSAYPK